VSEQVIALQYDRTRNRSLDLKFFHDTITGATPNGASDPVTLTSPSGSIYTSNMVQINDERYAIAANWKQERSRLEKVDYGLSVSTELDYDSLGASWKRQRDSKNRLSTYTHAASINLDNVRAEGGIPTGLAPSSDTTRQASDLKFVADYLLGVTQVYSRRSLLQMNYNIGLSYGYLTDPYKYITVKDTSTSLQYEKRPDLRLGNSLYTQFIYNHRNNVFRTSYRLYFDDWGILSHTLDLRYRQRLSHHWYVQPHFRYYSQSAAKFYGHVFYSPGPVSGYASADYRLGNVTSITAGMQMGKQFNRRWSFSVRLEYLRQGDRLGEFPQLNASIAQLSFRYKP
jgi:hypothetical protein